MVGLRLRLGRMALGLGAGLMEAGCWLMGLGERLAPIQTPPGLEDRIRARLAAERNPAARVPPHWKDWNL